MELKDCLSLLLQLGTLILVGGTLYVYWRQLLKMQDQAKSMQEQVIAVSKSSNAQNAISVIGFVQQEQYRKARQYVFSFLVGRNLPYNDEEKTNASLVCSSYDLLAVLVKHELISPELIADEWGPSVVRASKILGPFMADFRKNMGDQYWDDFPQLAARIEKHWIEAGRPLPEYGNIT